MMLSRTLAAGRALRPGASTRHFSSEGAEAKTNFFVANWDVLAVCGATYMCMLAKTPSKSDDKAAAASKASSVPASEESPTYGSKKASCVLSPDNGAAVSGVVSLMQKDNTEPSILEVTVRGLKPGRHGFQLHTTGNITEGAVSAGCIYDPHSQPHAGPADAQRKVGDLGNLVAGPDGVATAQLQDAHVMLGGPTSVVGRSLVVYEGADDLGRGGFTDSSTTGHVGKSVACGVIGVSN